MTDIEATAAFAGFREAIYDDFGLLTWLRTPLDRDAYSARVVAAGAERGFVFDEATVRAAMREGEQAWLMQGVEVVP